MTDLFSCTTVEQNGLKLWGSGAFFLPPQGMYYPVSFFTFLYFLADENNPTYARLPFSFSPLDAPKMSQRTRRVLTPLFSFATRKSSRERRFDRRRRVDGPRYPSASSSRRDSSRNNRTEWREECPLPLLLSPGDRQTSGRHSQVTLEPTRIRAR